MILDRLKAQLTGRSAGPETPTVAQGPAGAAGTAPGTGRVSVVIPLYNHARYIGEAVRSVLSQGPVLRELIVVDDGSRDDSAAVMAGLARTDPRIVFWSHPNRGAHATLNAGIHRATGDYVAILNSDDSFEPGRLDRLVALLEGDAGADLAASSISFMNGEGAAIENAWHAEALAELERSGDMAAALINGNFLMTTSNFVFRRSLVEEVGGFAPLRYAHDLDFALRLLARGRRIVLSPEKLLRYRMHDSNTISESHDRVRLEWAAVTAFFLHAIWDRPDAPPVDWACARALTEVTDRHLLTRPVLLLMAWFRRHPSDSLEHSAFAQDRALVDALGPDVR
ncbi:glycosyltransferase family 2 protein [Roseomonas elaeocarpi]|uniref:Glycosyltransferase family 2 protein n=1 Tax=Roseomonas elaeocarpi TaxID=907779 RepID=A0ABV6JSE8_9PROT